MQFTSQRRRAFTAVGAMAIAAVFVLAGCSTPAPSEPSSNADYSEYPTILDDAYKGESLDFWGWDEKDFDKPISDYVEAVAGIKVNYRQIANADFPTQVKLAAQSHTLPDAFKSETGQIPTLVQIGAIQDITDLVAPYKDLLPDLAWESVTYDGKIWGIPGNSPAGGMFYRQDVLDQYGIDGSSLTTWDKYTEAAKKISAESDGKVALFSDVQEFANMAYLPILANSKAEFLDADNNVMVSADSPEWQSAMEVFSKLLEPGVGTEITEWTPAWYQSLKDGTLASVPAGTWFLSIIQSQAPDSLGAWNFQPFPANEEGGDRYATNYGSAIVVISADTEKRDAAFQLVKAWTIDPEGSVGIGLQQLGISVISDAAVKSEYVKQPQKYFANDQPYWADALTAYTSMSYQAPVTTATAQATQIFATNMASFIGGQSADDFLTQLAKDLRAQIKEAK